ncbi:outer membrane protein assembly factor BamD [Acidithiobacillus sp. M4-SHS-6]|uniref:outer membrane protein assembly factor BamD n=1 Tax=Acidithiobacillus sp. M4-SHS-6 TaxID=3383024 RepID=UPI0039BE41A7
MPPLTIRPYKNILPFLLLVSTVITLALAGCASSPDKKGEAIHVAPVAQMFRPGQEALRRGDYNRAIRQFENLQSEYPYGPYAEQSQLDTAYAYYKSGDAKAAAAAATAFIKAHPANPHVVYAYYLKGLAEYEGIEGPEYTPTPDYEALRTFTYLAKTFPKTPYAVSARLHIAKIIDILGQRNLNICKFYYIRDAYVASANRCSRVITDYQLSPAREEALYYLSKSYAHLNLDQLARTTAIILHANYPQGRFTRKLRSLWENAPKASTRAAG